MWHPDGRHVGTMPGHAGPPGRAAELHQAHPVDAVSEVPVSDKVVPIGTAFSEAPPVEIVTDEKQKFCRHLHTVLDPVERRVTCRDCDASLDAYDVLVALADQWHRWEREAKMVNEANDEYRRIEREKWERARDRHLTAHPVHAAEFDPKRQSWTGERCRTCTRLEQTWSYRWGDPPELRANSEA